MLGIDLGKRASQILITLLVALAVPAAVAADHPYLYVDPQGVRWFTDRPIYDRAFLALGRYGRPTAERSCRGVTRPILSRKAARFDRAINRYATAHSLDPALVKSIIAVESCYDSRAVSRVGARGLMQLMPQTAAMFGVHDIFDPDENIAAGVAYLRRMLDRFDDNVSLALAAYNAGPTAVARHGGVPPYPETRRYVRRVLSGIRRFR